MVRRDPRHEWASPFVCPKSLEKVLGIEIPSGTYFAVTFNAHIASDGDLAEEAKRKGLGMDDIHNYFYQVRTDVYGNVVEGKNGNKAE